MTEENNQIKEQEKKEQGDISNNKWVAALIISAIPPGLHLEQAYTPNVWYSLPIILVASLIAGIILGTSLFQRLLYSVPFILANIVIVGFEMLYIRITNVSRITRLEMLLPIIIAVVVWGFAYSYVYKLIKPNSTNN